MVRKNFYEIIKNSDLNLKAEYERLHKLFHQKTSILKLKSSKSLYEMIESNFLKFPEAFRGRTISLEDFNRTYNFTFLSSWLPFNSVETLISFCEYITNLCDQLIACQSSISIDFKKTLELLRKAIDNCIDELGLVAAKIGDITIYVERNPAAISVAEIVPDEMMFSVLEYNHYRLSGDLIKKQSILKRMADYIEGDRTNLKSINSNLESQLFQLLNKFVRHDHSKTPYISIMQPEEIEATYDDIYQMWLLAKLELEHLNRKQRIAALLEQTNK